MLLISINLLILISYSFLYAKCGTSLVIIFIVFNSKIQLLEIYTWCPWYDTIDNTRHEKNFMNIYNISFKKKIVCNNIKVLFIYYEVYKQMT